MAVNTSPIFIDSVWQVGQQILPADTTTKKLLVTAGADGSRIDQINCSTNDTAGETLQFWVYDGSTYYHLRDVPLALGSGYNAVAGVDAIPTLAPTVGYLALQSGYSLYVSTLAAVTAAKQTDIVAQGGDF